MILIILIVMMNSYLMNIKKFYDSENITVKIIHNKDYMTDDFKLYQGGSDLLELLK